MKIKNMNDIKDGMVIELRNGKRYLRIGGVFISKTGHVNASSYNINNFVCETNSAYSIKKIYKTYGLSFDDIFNSRHLEKICEVESLDFFEAMDALKRGKLVANDQYEGIYKWDKGLLCKGKYNKDFVNADIFFKEICSNWRIIQEEEEK